MEALKALRKAKGLTASQLGEMVGVSGSAISQYETGKKNPSYPVLLALADALETTVDRLSGGLDGADARGVIFENDAQRILFDASSGAPQSAIYEAAALLQRYKEAANGT